jgi:putative cell wall-binding protein
MRPIGEILRPLSRIGTVAVVTAATLAMTSNAASAQLAPTAASTLATSVTATSAVLNGSVNPNGASTTYYFQYGTTSSYGLISQTYAAGAGNAAVAVNAPITGLAPNTTYYFQLVATNADGTSAGGQLTFLTSANVLVTTSQIYGADRYQTSAQIAESKYPGGVPSGYVVIATGLNFPDALAGNYLAGQLSAPILLSPPTTTDPAWSTVTAALTALDATHVFILGGTDAIGADVEAALSQNYTVVRIAGATRYDTMEQVDTYSGLVPGFGITGARTAIIATGDNFPDALAAGPLVWASKLPLILTDGTQASLTPQALAVINSLGITHFIVLGGSATISAGIVSQLATLGTVDEQFSGQDRTDTAAQLAAYEQSTYSFQRSSVILATGMNFPDALAGGPFGGDPKSMYFTITASDLGPFTTAALQGLSGLASLIYILGGPNVVDANASSEAITAVQGGGTGTLAPTVITGAATAITGTTATLSASVNPQASGTTVTFQYGTNAASLIFSSTTQTLLASSGLQTVSLTISGLAPGQVYYYRAVATNAYGTSDGLIQSFTAGSGQLTPQASTLAPTNVAATTATLNGTLNPNGGDTHFYYEYDTSPTFATAATTTSTDAGAGSTALAEPVNITGLAAGTVYYAQLVTSNAYGQTLGGTVSFKTAAPVVTSLSTTGGTTSGGTAVTVNGTGFTGASSVMFGGTPATNVVVNSDTQITITTPAEAAGTVHVTVTTPFGTSATSGADQYSYVAPPTMTAAVVTAGTYAGGTSTGTAGTVEVTFAAAVTCAQASDYVYSNGGVAMSTCTPVGGAAPQTHFVLAPANGTVVMATGNGSTLTYTQASPLTSTATYVAAGNSQVFEPSGDSVMTS